MPNELEQKKLNLFEQGFRFQSYYERNSSAIEEAREWRDRGYHTRILYDGTVYLVWIKKKK